MCVRVKPPGENTAPSFFFFVGAGLMTCHLGNQDDGEVCSVCVYPEIYTADSDRKTHLWEQISLTSHEVT